MAIASIAAPTSAEDSAGALASRLKASVSAALLTLVLCIPIILFRATADNDGAIYLAWRPWAVVIFMAIAFVGRFAVLTYAARPKADKVIAAPKATNALATRIISISGLLFLLLFPILAVWAFGSGGALKWVDSYGIQILIYVMLGWGLNIVVGLAGLLDLGYVAFYAVGAYSYTLLATTFGLSFWVCLPIAGILAALWGILLGFPVLRLRGDYLAIVTLAFGEIIRTILVNWVAFSGGSAGISSIPKITFFGLVFADREGGFDDYFGWDYSPIHGKLFLYYIILCLALLTNFVTLRLRRLPIGRAWEALREDEIACRSLGINTTNTKLTAFALGAFFGGLAGSFFAVRQGFISPESFTFSESATILAIVVLGGMGSQVGVAFAAAALIGGFELLRELEFVRYLPFDIIILPLAIIGFAVANYVTRRTALAVATAIVIIVIGALAVREGYLQALLGALAVPFPGPIGDIDFVMTDFDPTQYRGLLFGLAMVVMMVFRPRGIVSTRSPSIFLKERRAVSGDLVAEGHG